VAPVALLLLLALVGLIGTAPHPRWTGPLYKQATAIGLVLEAILGALLIATIRRSRTADGEELALKLRTGLTYFLPTAMLTLAVAIVVNLHLHLNTKFRPVQPKTVTPPRCLKHCVRPAQHSNGGWNFPVLDILLALLITAIVIAIIILLRRNFRRPPKRPPHGSLAMDPDQLRDALAEGAAALRDTEHDDARKAIIACYAAMERSLAGKGTQKTEATTPDELLAQATAEGLVHGPAAKTLTALFYEARFSTHPLAEDKRDAARHALSDLVAEVDA
jgi:hypothetical protein